MLKAFIIIIVVGLIVLLAGYIYNSLMTAEAFQAVHKMHADPPKEDRILRETQDWLRKRLSSGSPNNKPEFSFTPNRANLRGPAEAGSSELGRAPVRS